MDVKRDRMSCNNWCIRKVAFTVLQQMGCENVGLWVWKWLCRTQVSSACTAAGASLTSSVTVTVTTAL